MILDNAYIFHYIDSKSFSNNYLTIDSALSYLNYLNYSNLNNSLIKTINYEKLLTIEYLFSDNQEIQLLLTKIKEKIAQNYMFKIKFIDQCILKK